MKYVIQTILLILVTCCFGQNKPSYIQESHYFEFHSDFWINMHHFLFQQAKGDQVDHLKQDGNALLDIDEDSIFKALTADEHKSLNIAVQYYRNHLIDKSLLFELGDLRLWLQNQDIQTPIIDTTFTKEYSYILNNFSSVYKNRFWKIHDKHNKKILEKHIATVSEMEDGIIRKLEHLVGHEWPSTKIRIDLTAYANYAGGYTQNRPNYNTVLSTLDPFSSEPVFIETIFHEGSHVLFIRDSKFRSKIYLISKEMDMELPRNLWHASQFYICGRLVQNELEKKNINYKLNMDVRNIFSKYNTKKFRSTMDDYINGSANMENTIKALLSSLK